MDKCPCPVCEIHRKLNEWKDDGATDSDLLYIVMTAYARACDVEVIDLTAEDILEDENQRSIH